MNILQDLSDMQAVATANEDNMVSFWMQYGRTPGREVYEDAKLTYYTTGIAFPLFNAVFRAQLTVSEIDLMINEVIQHYARRGLPMFWWLGSGTRPSDLGKRLQEHGLIYTGDTPGMAVELAALPERVITEPDFTIEPVENAEALRQWVEVLSSSNDIPSSLYSPIFELEMQRGLGQAVALRRYLGRYQSEVVAAAALHLDAGAAGLYAVATRPQARGRGFGAAISLQPLLEARDLGYRVGVLQTSQMGQSVYTRLGFKTYCQFELYLFTGQAGIEENPVP